MFKRGNRGQGIDGIGARRGRTERKNGARMAKRKDSLSDEAEREDGAAEVGQGRGTYYSSWSWAGVAFASVGCCTVCGAVDDIAAHDWDVGDGEGKEEVKRSDKSRPRRHVITFNDLGAIF